MYDFLSITVFIAFGAIAMLNLMDDIQGDIENMEHNYY